MAPNYGCIIPYLSQFIKNGTYLRHNLFVKVNRHNNCISTEQKSSNFGEIKTLSKFTSFFRNFQGAWFRWKRIDIRIYHVYQNFSFIKTPMDWSKSMKTLKKCFYLLASACNSDQSILSHVIFTRLHETFQLRSFTIDHETFQIKTENLRFP